MFIQTYRNYINAYNVCAKTLAKYMSGEGGLRTFIDVRSHHCYINARPVTTH
jgi:hypothetical protein